MKKIYTLLASLIMTSLGFAQTNIYTQSFEVANDGYSSSVTEGSTFQDVFNRIDASAASGGDIGGNATFIWAIEDSNVTPATITLDQMDVTGFSDFTFSIDMLAHHYQDWDSTDELLISYSIDGAIAENLMWVQMVRDPGNLGDISNGPAAIDAGFDNDGDCGASTTLPAISTGTIHGCTVSASNFATFTSSTIPLNGNTTLDIVLTFNGLTAGDEGLYLDNISVDGTSGGTASTEVNFIGSSISVSEGIGTHELEFTIANEDASNATSFDVVLISGDASDIDSYTTQTVTFPAGSFADQVIELTITDDAIFESDEVLTFEIQNVSGGATAIIGSNNTFDLTITNNDAPATIGLPYSEDFSNCETALWLPFDESGGNFWSCAGGEYNMNGFPNPDDVDWLISNFSIDFDAQGNETISIETSERFGNTINEAGEFELRYSTDYAGYGDPTNATWTALVFDPNNTSTNATASAPSTTFVDASGITGTAYLAFVYDTAAGSGAEDWRVSDISIFEGAPNTSVEFIGTSVSVAEDVGTVDLEFTITNEDATNATTFDVVLTSGEASDIDSYTTQNVSFPAGSVADQTVTITITDDLLEEADETLTFEIQNVSGGNNAFIGTNSSFDLTILANDEPVIPGLLYDADFTNDGDGFPAHNSSSPPAAGPTSTGLFGAAPNQWALSYDTAPNTDGSDNIFEVVGGELVCDDWGGQGIFTSQVIDVTGISVVDISATGINVGANENNFTYFYIIDGGTRVETPVSSSNGDPVNYSLTGINVSGATDLEVGYEFSENGGGDGYSISEFIVVEGSTTTSVQFASTSDVVFEDAGTYDLTFEILFEDATNATTFDVVLTSGDAGDIDAYTTQTVTFPAGSSANQTVTVTITDDMVEESAEVFTFEIQNVAGGNSATAGTNTSFDLTIQDNDGNVALPGDVVISEIMYNSSGTDDEWIEIYNASGADITLDSDWRLNYQSTTYDFTGTLIPADSYLTIALGSNGDGTYNNDNPFTPDVSEIGTPVATISDSNNLGNSSATIELIFDPSGANTTIDIVTYDDGSPWPTTADGNGPSLELIDVTFDNTVGANWVASSFYDGGTPGSAYVAPITYTFNGVWSPSDPNGTATSNDDIIIASGNAVINSNTTCNTMTVNPGASVTVDAGTTLEATNGLTLESSSTSYSSLIPNGTIVGTMEYERHVNINGSGTTGSNDLVSAPLTGQQFDDFAAANPNIFSNGAGTLYLFGPFEKVTGQYVTWANTETATLDAGVGYRAASTDNDTFTFTGNAETGTITHDIVNQGTNNQEWNLVGNPYPSYLNVQQFLSGDAGGGLTNIQLFDGPTAAIYGYDGSAQNGWTIYNLANTSASTVIAPGQGFMVSADAANVATGDLTFTPAMRSTGNSDDFIVGRNAELTYVKLNLSANEKAFNTEFYFNTNASTGFDIGYDANLWGNTTPEFAIYSHLVQDNVGDPVALQTLNSNELDNVTIPLGVNANQGEQLTFSIADINVPASVKIYLEDVVANTVTLLNETDYSITPTTPLNGTGRFFLRTSNEALSTMDNSLDLLDIFTLKSSKELVISGQLLDAKTMLTLYDTQGRLVLSTQLDNENLQNRIDTSSLSGGVYVVSINNDIQQKTQKVIIK
ncbi:lamin tail domain-containing protein [Psychroserpens sp. S379A]|uniref:lamin tail domain-containing protein n=1 Tax=Psychroserpens sp. S379A TaxID=3415137 RepID=UPI003C7BE730